MRFEEIMPFVFATPSTRIWYDIVEFSYFYNGKKYTEFAMERFLSNKCNKFEVGKTYPLCVNPKKPRDIRCTNQMLTVMEFFCTIVGGVFLLALFGLVIKQIFM